MIPDNLSVMVSVIALVAATLLAAGLVGAYQRHQQYRRRRIQALIQGAQRNERLLQQLSGVNLPHDIRVLLRRDIQDRYRAVAALHAGYPAIGELVQQAEQRCSSEPGDAGRQLPVPPDATVFEQWRQGMQELLALVQHNGVLRPLAAATRRDYQEQLLVRLAECLYGHHMNEADKLKQDARHMTARNRIQHLQEMLRALPSSSERIQELLAEAEAAYRYLLDGIVRAAEDQLAAGG